MRPYDTDELLLDTRRLAERIEAHAAAGHELLARESVRTAGGLLSFEGPASYLNKACGFPPGRRFTEADAEGIETFFVTRGVEPRVEIAPHDRDDRLLAGDRDRAQRCPPRLPRGLHLRGSRQTIGVTGGSDGRGRRLASGEVAS